MCFSPTDSYPSGMGEYWYRLVKTDYDLVHMKDALDQSTSITTVTGGEKFKENIASVLKLSEIEEVENIVKEYDKVSAESDVGVFDAIYQGRLSLFLNDKEFLKDTLFCEWAYYYDYETEMFVVVENREGKQHEISLTENNWQEFFKMLQ